MCFMMWCFHCSVEDSFIGGDVSIIVCHRILPPGTARDNWSEGLFKFVKSSETWSYETVQFKYKMIRIELNDYVDCISLHTYAQSSNHEYPGFWEAGSVGVTVILCDAWGPFRSQPNAEGAPQSCLGLQPHTAANGYVVTSTGNH